MKLPGITIDHSFGDIITDTSGQQYLDLCMGFGTVSLGHGHPQISTLIKQQLDTTFSPGFLHSKVRQEAIAAIDSIIPASHKTLAILSTGMEAVEASLRLATHITQRKKLLAFQGSMHGKSLLTAALANTDSTLQRQHICSLPYVSQLNEEQVLDNLQAHLTSGEYAALLVEPVQMSNNGVVPSGSFFLKMHDICRENQTLLIFDEILSGFYRSGTCFFFQQSGLMPDILLTGKALGNGLPTSIIIANKSLTTNALPYRPESTYAHHPLACAAIKGSIAISREINLEDRVNSIENIVRETLESSKIFGSGAMWCYKIGTAERTVEFYQELVSRRIVVSFFKGYIRLLPSYFIDSELLRDACKTITEIDQCILL